MASQDSQLIRHDLEAKIVKRCWENEGFRAEFIAHPEGAFVKYLEVPAASLPKVVVHEEQPGSWHIVLPAKQVNANELSEQDLERVAGGPTPDVLKVIAVNNAFVASGGLISVSGVGSAVFSLKENHGW
jgi:hypothetical protein